MKVYIAHPISGKSGEEIINWFSSAVERLKSFGYDVYYPMIGKGEFRNNVAFKAYDNNQNPLTTNHAIFERDKWMVSQVDVVYVDLSDTTIVSIGCMMELAWASLLGKHTVITLPNVNIHKHAFVLESADIVFETEAESFNYLENLSKRLM